jgi:hypothetical protein
MVITTALAAAGAMLIQDIMGVLLVQAEARNRAGLAAAFDSLMWLAQICTVTISVTALQGHQLGAKAIILIFVEAANIAGCFAGVAIGRRLIKETKAACACGCPVPAKEAG